MATIQTNSPIGGRNVVDKRRALTDVNPMSAASTTAAASNSTLDAALTAANGAYYTATKLQQEGQNDKIYALRLANESAGI